jgi:hypothetical protein
MSNLLNQSKQPEYPKPDKAKQERLVALARVVRDQFHDVPVIGYNYLITLADVADERDILKHEIEEYR